VLIVGAICQVLVVVVWVAVAARQPGGRPAWPGVGGAVEKYVQAQRAIYALPVIFHALAAVVLSAAAVAWSRPVITTRLVVAAAVCAHVLPLLMMLLPWRNFSNPVNYFRTTVLGQGGACADTLPNLCAAVQNSSAAAALRSCAAELCRVTSGADCAAVRCSKVAEIAALRWGAESGWGAAAALFKVVAPTLFAAAGAPRDAAGALSVLWPRSRFFPWIARTSCLFTAPVVVAFLIPLHQATGNALFAMAFLAYAAACVAPLWRAPAARGAELGLSALSAALFIAFCAVRAMHGGAAELLRLAGSGAHQYYINAPECVCFFLAGYAGRLLLSALAADVMAHARTSVAAHEPSGLGAPLIEALARDDLDAFRAVPASQMSVDGWTAAHWACALGASRCLAAIAEGAPVEQLFSVDVAGDTPLHIACELGHLGCVWPLLKADPLLAVSVRDALSADALHRAARYDRDGCALALLRAGANAAVAPNPSALPLEDAASLRPRPSAVRFAEPHLAPANSSSSAAVVRPASSHVSTVSTAAPAAPASSEDSYGGGGDEENEPPSVWALQRRSSAVRRAIEEAEDDGGAPISSSPASARVNGGTAASRFSRRPEVLDLQTIRRQSSAVASAAQAAAASPSPAPTGRQSTNPHASNGAAAAAAKKVGLAVSPLAISAHEFLCALIIDREDSMDALRQALRLPFRCCPDRHPATRGFLEALDPNDLFSPGQPGSARSTHSRHTARLSSVSSRRRARGSSDASSSSGSGSYSGSGSLSRSMSGSSAEYSYYDD
jgi:hypothetical protein